jgi:hypothetical protein
MAGKQPPGSVLIDDNFWLWHRTPPGTNVYGSIE